MSHRSPNFYNRYLHDTGDSHPPTPPGSSGSPHSVASRPVPPTPGGSFSLPGYTPIRETGQGSQGPGPVPQQTPTQPEQPIDRAEYMAILESILKEEQHKYLPNLHPDRPKGTHWFILDGLVASTISEILEKDFQEPHANVSQTPAYILDRWFMTFARKFHWEFAITSLVRKQWEALLRVRMCDKVGRWKGSWKIKGDDAMPKWMKPEVWEGLIRYWRTEKSIKKSEACSKARMSDPEGIGPHKHTSGRTSFAARALQEQEASGDTHPDLLKTLEKTKRNKNGDFVDKRAERLYNEVDAKITQLSQASGEGSSASGGLSTAQRNQVYAETAPRKKGRVYGTGSLGSMIDQCISPEGFSQTSRSSSDQELREIVDRQSQVIDQTQVQLAKANKKIAILTDLWSHMSTNDPVVSNLIKNLMVVDQEPAEEPAEEPDNPDDL